MLGGGGGMLGGGGGMLGSGRLVACTLATGIAGGGTSGTNTGGGAEVAGIAGALVTGGGGGGGTEGGAPVKPVGGAQRGGSSPCGTGSRFAAGSGGTPTIDGSHAGASGWLGEIVEPVRAGGWALPSGNPIGAPISAITGGGVGLESEGPCASPSIGTPCKGGGKVGGGVESSSGGGVESASGGGPDIALGSPENDAGVGSNDGGAADIGGPAMGCGPVARGAGPDRLVVGAGGHPGGSACDAALSCSKSIRCAQMKTSSPGDKMCGPWMRVPLTNVPFVDSRSMSVMSAPVWRMRA